MLVIRVYFCNICLLNHDKLSVITYGISLFTCLLFLAHSYKHVFIAISRLSALQCTVTVHIVVQYFRKRYF